MVAFSDSEDHFKTFAQQLERAIAKYGDLSEEDFTAKQKAQVEGLVALETEFRSTLIKHADGNKIYKQFVNFICHEKKNILAARPYFRERQEVFTNEISSFLKKKDEVGLYAYHFNYHFVQFVMRARKWSQTAKLRVLARKIERARTELVEMNMPLAISRARLFWSKTQRSHLDFMDLIQIAAEGLMSAIDKFVLPYSPVFRAVAIGRMLGNFIEQYSETKIHFYPTDKRKIYRANKVAHKFGHTIDYQKLADEVNKGVEGAQKTTAAEIADLLAAASCLSVDITHPSSKQGEEGTEMIERISSPPEQRPDESTEMNEAYNVMFDAAKKCLSLFEIKFLRLRGLAI